MSDDLTLATASAQILAAKLPLTHCESFSRVSTSSWFHEEQNSPPGLSPSQRIIVDARVLQLGCLPCEQELAESLGHPPLSLQLSFHNGLWRLIRWR